MRTKLNQLTKTGLIKGLDEFKKILEKDFLLISAYNPMS